MAGARINLGLKNLNISFTGFEGLTQENSGVMKDSDWLNNNMPSVKTTYSIGNCYGDKNFLTSLLCSWDISLCSGLKLIPVTEAEYKYDSFHRNRGAKGWYGDYKGIYDDNGRLIKVIKRDPPVSWNDADALEFPYRRWDESKGRYLNGTIDRIDYKKHTIQMWTGLNVMFYKDSFTMVTGFSVLPFAYYSAEDSHYVYTDKNILHMIQTDYFNGFKFSLKLQYTLFDFTRLYFEAESLNAGISSGDLYSGWSKSREQKSGSSEQILSVKAGVKIILM